MRDEDTLIEDLFKKSSVDWNVKLCDEFGFDFNSLVSVVNDYNYNIPSEKTIHESLINQQVSVGHNTEESFEELSESEASENKPITDINKILSTVISFKRKMCNFSLDYGDSLRNYIFFGIDFINCDFTGIVIDGSVFNNCSFTNCMFDNSFISSSKLIECQFTKCDLDRIKLNKCGLFGLNLIDCSLEEGMFIDCVSHSVSYFNCEMDSMSLISGSMHGCSIHNSSFKNSVMNVLVCSCLDIGNSNFKRSQLVNCRFVGSSFDSIHIDGAVQFGNAYMGCYVSSDIQEFFVEDVENDSDSEEDEEDELKERSFDEIMGNDEDDE